MVYGPQADKNAIFYLAGRNSLEDLQNSST